MNEDFGSEKQDWNWRYYDHGGDRITRTEHAWTLLDYIVRDATAGGDGNLPKGVGEVLARLERLGKKMSVSHICEIAHLIKTITDWHER